jgi:hypothetical protein
LHYIFDVAREKSSFLDVFLGFGDGNGGAVFERLEDVFLSSSACFATDGRIGFFERRFEELVSS